MIRRFFRKKKKSEERNEITRTKTHVAKDTALQGMGSSPPDKRLPRSVAPGKTTNERILQAQIESLKSERDELSILVSGIQDAILALDPNGCVLFYNSQCELMFPSLKFEQFDETNIIPALNHKEISGAFQVSLRESKSFSLKSVKVESEKGKKYVALNVSPLKKADRSVYGAVGIFHDVTELTLAEKMRIDFVANVSHELRTPLTSIKGYTDTLSLDVAAGRSIDPKFLKVIARNATRLMDLISDLLDLSSMDAGTDVIQKDRLDTELLTERVLDQMRQRLEKRTRPIDVVCRAPYVWADSRRVEQVLTNLLDNALKYTPDDAQILISWEPHQGSHDVLLKVKDSGPGIPKESHDRLFERFYRVDKGRSRDQGGTGLGLAIVKHIMQRHGGTVWIQSDIGQGTQFTCQFPDAAPIRG